MTHDRNQIAAALQRTGFENWQSPLIASQPNRPVKRPMHLPGIGRVGAVMLLLYESAEPTRTSIVLTRRQPHLTHHAGQISFPGGSQDRDETPVETALRETREEIGVDIEQIEILGKLNSLYIPPSDFTIHPVVGWYSGPARFQISEQEVAEIMVVELAQLLAPQALQNGPIVNGPSAVNISHYLVSGYQVWGATAIVLHEFLERIRAADLRQE